MSRLFRTSVTEVEEFLACPRRWALHRLHRVPKIKGPALADGIAVHRQTSAILSGRPLPYDRESPFGKMGQALAELAPSRTGVKVEARLMIEVPERGFSIALRPDAMVPGEWFSDWKTTGAQRPTQKLPGGEKFWTLQSLRNSIQGNTYAWGLMRRFKIPTQPARWGYCSKRFDPGQTPRTWVVDHEFERAETQAWVETHVFPVIEAIRAHRQAFAAAPFAGRDVPHRPEACDWTGRWCDAAGQCGLVSSPVGTYADLHLPILPD